MSTTATYAPAKMDPDIQRDWVAALRSGEYQQDTGALKTPTGYCCLGVLVDVIQRKHPEVLSDLGITVTETDAVGLECSWLDPWSNDDGEREHCETDAELPDPLAKRLGIGTVGQLPWQSTADGQELALAGLNDGEYGPTETFLQLADRIEAGQLTAPTSA